MAIGSLSVEITASIAQLERQLKAVEQKLAKTGKTIDDTLATPGAKMAVNMGKVFAVMGAIEFAAKAASAGVSLLDAFSAQAAGNAAEASKHFDAVAETIKQLPMGIGPVAAAIEDLMHKVMGVDEAMRRVTKAQKDASARKSVNDISLEMNFQRNLLEQQVGILSERDAIQKIFLENVLEHTKLNEEFIKRQREILKMEGVSAAHKDTLLNKLAVEHGLRQDILNIQKEEQQEQIRIKEAQDEKHRRMKKDIELHKEYLVVDQKRLNIIQRQMGISNQGTMGDKSGFTSTISTALGSFTSADLNVEDKITELTRESNELQREINHSTRRIENFTEQMSKEMGVN